MPRIDFNKAVTEGKRLVTSIERNQMRLGELADQVTTQYGKQTLKRFAEAIGMVPCTLERQRSVFRQYKDSGGVAGIYFSVAQALAKHPDRAKIISDHPNITAREARAEMRAYRQRQEPREANAGWTVEEAKRWFKDWVGRASQAIEDGPAIDNVDPNVLKQAIEPTLLDTPVKGAAAWEKLVKRLRRLLDEESDKAA
jgi:hypothetical protein